MGISLRIFIAAPYAAERTSPPRPSGGFSAPDDQGRACGDDVLRPVARRVGGRAVDLRRVLARERAAAVARRAAVGVDDDLPAGEASVTHRAADHELAGRVDVDEVAVLEPTLVVQV